jgi:hypothetical protein
LEYISNKLIKTQQQLAAAIAFIKVNEKIEKTAFEEASGVGNVVL